MGKGKAGVGMARQQKPHKTLLGSRNEDEAGTMRNVGFKSPPSG